MLSVYALGPLMSRGFEIFFNVPLGFCLNSSVLPCADPKEALLQPIKHMDRRKERFFLMWPSKRARFMIISSLNTSLCVNRRRACGECFRAMVEEWTANGPLPAVHYWHDWEHMISWHRFSDFCGGTAENKRSCTVVINSDFQRKTLVYWNCPGESGRSEERRVGKECGS